MWLPIRHCEPGREPIVFERITEVGYRFDKDGVQHGFVTLLDVNHNSILHTIPEWCEVAEGEV